MTKEGWVVLWSLVIPVIDGDVDSFWGALCRDLRQSSPSIQLPPLAAAYATEPHLPGRSTNYRLDQSESWLRANIPHFPFEVLDTEKMRGLMFFWLWSGFNNFLMPRFGRGDFNNWYGSYFAAFSVAGVEMPMAVAGVGLGDESPTEETIVLSVSCLADGGAASISTVDAVRREYARVADAYGSRISSAFTEISNRRVPPPWPI